ncbi:ankyrin repeat domain-containing protein [Wolbachia endosymbiont of Frankliniella intonsa]|uniref:ankyrin repeat domain-containing protein n=1 Tax=Wolbachia endosymbiont of Frankliniella intonsa TaxID=2902422 RepID=UPI00244EAEE5|nr:ankyrin repeat domain-containing protein [Wolbachia endosymbiont of Frankliniella intonsa]WGJ61848.1 ankyrin repeat domain-containing protein [Wolbachia endosymbiont of Frankliniella intonsa]
MISGSDNYGHEFLATTYSGGAEIDAQGNDANTPLHWAAKYDHLNVVEKLIEKGTEIDAKDNKDNTPLHWAAKYDHLNVVEKLIEKGAKIDAKDNYSGNTPLHLSAEYCYLSIVEKLIEKGAKIDAKNNDDNTPLHLAKRNGYLNVVRKLSEAGAVNVNNNYDHTLLELAQRYKRSKLAKALREEQSEGHSQRRHRHHNGEQRYLRFAHLELEGDDRSVENDNPAVGNNQATSGASKVSSWINDFCSWVKEKSEMVVSNVVNGLYGDSTNVSHSGKSSVQGISKENVSNKGLSSSWKKVEGSTNFGAALPKGASSTASSISQVYAQSDIIGLMLLVPIFMNTMGRKFVLPLLSADQPISPEKVQVYASNITNGFREVLEQQAKLKDGIQMHRLNIDFWEMQEVVTGKIIGSKFNEIPEILNSYVEKALPIVFPKANDKGIIKYLSYNGI